MPPSCCTNAANRLVYALVGAAALAEAANLVGAAALAEAANLVGDVKEN